MYKNKEHGRSKAGPLRPVPLFPFASSRPHAFAFPLLSLCLSAFVVKKFRSNTQRGLKTFGHFHICNKTPRHFQHFNLTPSIFLQLKDPASPLHMERGGEMFDYRSDEGVRWMQKLTANFIEDFAQAGGFLFGEIT